MRKRVVGMWFVCLLLVGMRLSGRLLVCVGGGNEGGGNPVGVFAVCQNAVVGMMLGDVKGAGRNWDSQAEYVHRQWY